MSNIHGFGDYQKNSMDNNNIGSMMSPIGFGGDVQRKFRINLRNFASNWWPKVESCTTKKRIIF